MSWRSSAETKQESVRQWTHDPCGSSTTDNPVGSKQFFDSVAAHRYGTYAPWMRSAVGFDRFRGKRLLEIGCGMGTDLAQFAAAGAIVTGIDFTPRSIELTKQRFAAYGLSGEFFAGDAEQLDFPDETFDVVYAFGVLHHTPDTEGAVREIYRALKPDGTAIVMLYHRDSWHYWIRLFLYEGIWRRQLRSKTMADLMSEKVEFSESGARPLVKVYSRGQARRLFRDFRGVRTRVYQLTAEELPVPIRLVPGAVAALGRLAGWNLLVTAEK